VASVTAYGEFIVPHRLTPVSEAWAFCLRISPPNVGIDNRPGTSSDLNIRGVACSCRASCPGRAQHEVIRPCRSGTPALSQSKKLFPHLRAPLSPLHRVAGHDSHPPPPPPPPPKRAFSITLPAGAMDRS